MQRRWRGQAWVFRGILDVDWEICSYSLVRDLKRQGMLTYEQLGQYCMINVDPEFPRKVRPGDFIVAEENMGYGHDHDHACMSIRGAGVGAVLCESAAPYFLRNSLDHGLPVLEIPGISAVVATGDALEVDIAQGTLTHLATGRVLSFPPFPPFILERLDAGGVYPMLHARLYAGRRGRWEDPVAGGAADPGEET
jgi:3-isopropylmalate/(R)-2-methylmalate dehydratase small subunit